MQCCSHPSLFLKKTTSSGHTCPQTGHGKQHAGAIQGAHLTDCFTSCGGSLLGRTSRERWVPNPISRNGTCYLRDRIPKAPEMCSSRPLLAPRGLTPAQVFLCTNTCHCTSGKKPNWGGDLRPEPVVGCRTSQRELQFAIHFRAMPRISYRYKRQNWRCQGSRASLFCFSLES